MSLMMSMLMTFIALALVTVMMMTMMMGGDFNDDHPGAHAKMEWMCKSADKPVGEPCTRLLYGHSCRTVMGRNFATLYATD